MLCASCQCPANACAKQLQPRSKRHVNSYYRAASHHSMRDVQKLPLVLNVSMRLFFCCLLLFLLSALCCGLGGGSLFSTLGMESREWAFQHEMMAWSIWVRNLWLLMNQILIHQYLAKRERSQITSMAKSPTFPAPDSKENGWEILHHQHKLSALWALFRVHPGPADFGARWFGRHFTCPHGHLRPLSPQPCWKTRGGAWPPHRHHCAILEISLRSSMQTTGMAPNGISMASALPPFHRPTVLIPLFVKGWGGMVQRYPQSWGRDVWNALPLSTFHLLYTATPPGTSLSGGESAVTGLHGPSG